MELSATSLVRRAIAYAVLSFPVCLLALSACGGGGGNGALISPTPSPNFSGGGVLVSTFAGTANPGADGVGAAARFQRPSDSVSDGLNLYVADAGNHTIRRIVLSTGQVSTLAGKVGVPGATDGLGSAATFNSPSGITIDSTNTNLYVADTGNNMIRQVVIATGAVSAVAGTGVAGATDGAGAVATFSSPHGITADSGSLYVADTGNNKVRRVDITTGTVTSLNGLSGFQGSAGAIDGTLFNATFNAPQGITRIGTALYVGDTGNNKIRKLDLVTQSVTSVTGVPNTVAVPGALDGDAASAAFFAPAGMGTDGTDLYVADSGNNKIRHVAIATLTVSSLTGASSVPGTAGFADGAASSVSFTQPAGVTLTGNSVLVADTGNNTIRSISLVSMQSSTLAGSALGNTGANGLGAVARFKLPEGLVSDGTNVYVADSGNHTIRKIVLATGVVTTLAGQSGVAGAADGIGAAATFNNPTGIATDGVNLYVADTNNNKIRQVALATGAVSSLTGVPGSAVVAGATDGAGIAAAFNGPSGIATDGLNLYVADTSNNKIRRVVISSGAVSSLTGAADTATVAGAADGAASAVAFSQPFGIVIDSAKTNLYVTDTGNNKIRQVEIASGAASSVTGVSSTAVAAGAADGGSATASFAQPRGIATDGVNLYVADSGNNKIRQAVIATGVVSSLTGTANTAAAAGHADGSPAAATFSGPYGVTAAGSSLYVADTGNSVIRKIQ